MPWPSFNADGDALPAGGVPPPGMIEGCAASLYDVVRAVRDASAVSYAPHGQPGRATWLALDRCHVHAWLAHAKWIRGDVSKARRCTALLLRELRSMREEGLLALPTNAPPHVGQRLLRAFGQAQAASDVMALFKKARVTAFDPLTGAPLTQRKHDTEER